MTLADFIEVLRTQHGWERVQVGIEEIGFYHDRFPYYESLDELDAPILRIVTLRTSLCYVECPSLTERFRERCPNGVWVKIEPLVKRIPLSMPPERDTRTED